MNLLIVDDELAAIQTIRNHLCWDQLGFENIYTASNKEQAMKQIQTKEIHILLCDIEMPLGSGLELLEWVKAEDREICCIFMTCHAEFEYAQKAVRLGSYDYILKPLNFEKLGEVLLNAMQKVMENEQLNLVNSYWEDGRKYVIKHFWKDLLVGEIPPNEESIRRCRQLRYLDISLDAQYLPLLLCVKRWPEHMEKEDKKLFFYAICNIAGELFTVDGIKHEILSLSGDMILVLWWDTERKSGSLENLIREKCNTFVDTVYRYYQTDAYSYIGELAGICDVPAQLEDLQTMNYNNVLMSQTVLFLNRGKVFLHSYEQRGNKSEWMEIWRKLIRDRQYTQLRINLEQMFSRAARHGIMNRSYLQGICTDFQYLLYEFSSKHNLLLDNLFGDETARTCSDQASASYENLMQWVNLAIERIEAYENKDSDILSPVEITKRYIENHLSDELSMEEIAEYVHLSADYLNRIFKREEGVVLSKYVVQKKVEKAKWLMHNTSMTLGNIGAMVGYYNYSSFNRIFQKETGVSPQAYKKSVLMTENEK